MNMPGGETDDNSTPVPGTSGTNYLFAGATEYNYAASNGANYFNINFSWTQLTTTLGGTIGSGSTATYLTNLKNSVTAALATGAYVSIRCAPTAANYGGVYCGYITSAPSNVQPKCVGQSGGATDAQFASLWSQLAVIFKDQQRVIFDLCNEPNNNTTSAQTAALWFSAAQAAITAIRATGSTNTIFVEGVGYSAAVDWLSNNSSYASSITDPIAGGTVVCVHDYWDGSTGDGGFNTDISTNAAPTVGNNNVGVLHLTTTNETGSAGTGVLNWAQTNNLKLFIGEMGCAYNATIGNATTACTNYYNEIAANQKNIIGIAWWVFGSSFYQNAGQPYYQYPTSGPPFTTPSPNLANWQIFLPLKAG
jgi:endoglucanase